MSFFLECLQHVNVPSPGYEPWLTARGVPRGVARALAFIIVRRGRQMAREAKRRPQVVNAIRFLAAGGRQKAAVTRKVKILLSAWEETSIVEELFDNAGRAEFEFIRVLKAIAAGDGTALQRAIEIAADLAPHLITSRGLKLTAASAAHEYFLEKVICKWERRAPAYTWNDIEGKFTDAAAEATRREFGLEKFDPRPAYRRFKRQASVKNSQRVP